MSLVNDMLKDLDKRNRAPLQSGQPGAAIDYSENEYNLPYKKIGIVIVIGVLLGLGASYFLLSEPESQPVNPVSVVQPSSTENSSTGQEADLPVPELAQISARIAGGRETNTGFEIRIEVSEAVPYEILSRTDTRLQVLIRNVMELGNTAPVMEGMAVMRSTDGMLLTLDLDRSAEFLVYENAVGQLFAVTVEGFWEDSGDSEIDPTINLNNNLSDAGNQSNNAESFNSEAETQLDAGDDSTETVTQPVRTTRELSFQDRDRNTSQQGLRFARDGEMLEAYNTLYSFIGDNPEAHQSRNTLATLLFAQQEYAQANAVVEEGLYLAPNHSGYKKIKARLLIREGDYDTAIRLFNSSPPVMTDDPEYFELLASLHQQNGSHDIAIETYQELIRTDTSIGRWWTGMAISHEALGNSNDALNSYQVGMQSENLDSRLRQYSQNRIRVLSNQ